MLLPDLAPSGAPKGLSRGSASVQQRWWRSEGRRSMAGQRKATVEPRSRRYGEELKEGWALPALV